MTSAKMAAKIVRTLEARGGFDHWWDNVEREDRKEILGEIRDMLEEFIWDHQQTDRKTIWVEEKKK